MINNWAKLIENYRTRSIHIDVVCIYFYAHRILSLLWYWYVCFLLIVHCFSIVFWLNLHGFAVLTAAISSLHRNGWTISILTIEFSIFSSFIEQNTTGGEDKKNVYQCNNKIMLDNVERFNRLIDMIMKFQPNNVLTK